MSISLDLGCGPEPKNVFRATEIFGVDINNFENPNIRVADLAVEPIPFEDNFFDFVTGFDFLEHIPRVLYIGRERRQPFIDIMSEVWRVLKPGGETFFATPAFPHPEAFQDPQHVNIITENSILYFSAPQWLELCQAYGFKGRFEVVRQVWANQPIEICEGSYYNNVPYHLVWHLKAIK
jgi:SAM-dependent methyltransferase